MRKPLALCLAFFLVSGIASIAVAGKKKAKKKDSGVRVELTSVVMLPEQLQSDTAITEMSEEELADAGYTLTGNLKIGIVTLRCKFRMDRTEKCKSPKKADDFHRVVLEHVRANGAGLIRVGRPGEPERVPVLGKICTAWRHSKLGDVPECASWGAADVGYDMVKFASGTVWHRLP